MRSGFPSLVLLLASIVRLDAADKPAEVKGPYSPADELRHFRIAPGLRMELVACEPQIECPVAMAFDEDGKLWVVEMRDYPNGPGKGQPGQGRIKVLEDRDGDGQYEHATIFADELLFANGLMPWRGGVVVTAAPHIVYLKDTDGDGKADKREVLYEGFAALNPQLRVSHPLLGLDNWVYVSNGLRGGEIVRSGKTDAKPIKLSGMDFRFDLVRNREEAISGMGQYGNTFDDWGNRFVCDNRHHLRHIVLADRYLKRNPNLAVPAVVEDVSELEVSALGGGAQVYPLSKNWTTSNLHAGRFTAACGVFIYRGNLLPKEYRGAAFTCDPTGNLVHAETLKLEGGSFRATPMFKEKEFFATPDDWCRPVSLAHGPDGAMYVVDMYRAVIEHPEFMPTELKNRPDLLLGKDKGRIWRIVPENHRTKTETPALSKSTTEQLVEFLAHRDAWWRTTAQRLLLERQDKTAIEPLKKLCDKSGWPEVRAHAAWLLESFGSLDEALVMRLLKDQHPRVREQALLLAERFLQKNEAIQKLVVALAGDSDKRVRFQTALSLGEWQDSRILRPLAAIALTNADDRWTRFAVASAAPKSAEALVLEMHTGPHKFYEFNSPAHFQLIRELSALVGSRNDQDEVAGLLMHLPDKGPDAMRWKMAGLSGLAEGLGRRGARLADVVAAFHKEHKSVADETNRLLATMGNIAADSKRNNEERLEASKLLAHAPWEVAQSPLSRLLQDEQNQELRVAAIRALSNHPSKEASSLLMKDWRSHTPTLRREITDAMLRKPERVLVLLGEIEAGRVKPRELDAASTKRILANTRPDIREKAKKLLDAGVPEERKQIMERYREALTRTGDNLKGREVFRQNCASCHKIAGIGNITGPDISDTRTKTAEMLLRDILDPNAAIDANYIGYRVVTKDGKSLDGIVQSETASSVTLRRGDNQTDVILRQDIEEMRSSGQSLMPEGLEKTITVEQMADLLAFLKNWRYLDGAVPVPK